MQGGSGITLHDIAYNGSRIVYELAFQDLMVAYSGYGGAALSSEPSVRFCIIKMGSYKK